MTSMCRQKLSFFDNIFKAKKRVNSAQNPEIGITADSVDLWVESTGFL